MVLVIGCAVHGSWWGVCVVLAGGSGDDGVVAMCVVVVAMLVMCVVVHVELRCGGSWHALPLPSQAVSPGAVVVGDVVVVVAVVVAYAL